MYRVYSPRKRSTVFLVLLLLIGACTACAGGSDSSEAEQIASDKATMEALATEIALKVEGPTETVSPLTLTPLPPSSATPLSWPTDVPGQDLERVPRPSGGARVMYDGSVNCQGTYYDVAVYYVPGPQASDQLGNWYLDVMPTYGWHIDTFKDAGHMLTYKWQRPINQEGPSRAWVWITKEYQPALTFAGCSWTLPEGRPTDMTVSLVTRYGGD